MSRFTRLLAGAVICGATWVPTALHADAAPAVYVVRSGDSLYAIASRFDIRLADLLRANRLTMTSVIYPGQQLTVPGGGAVSGGSGTTTYTVKAGDWLARIASRHGVTLRALLDANRLTVTSVIMPGQQLVIPAGGTGGTGGGAGGTGFTTYTVQAGDWLTRIASRHGVTLRALLDANRLTVTSLILPGQQLRVPTSGSGGGGSPTRPPAPPTAGATYTVRAGDTLGAIASTHGVTLDALLAANGFTRNTLIMPGMQVKLPAGAQVSKVDSVINYALAQIGKPYRFFSRGPTAFDCSGLTLAAYAQAGVSLIHYSAAQAGQGVAVDFTNEPIRAGDLVFQDTDRDGVINHVGIAIGNGRWVQARSSRHTVSVGPLPSADYIVAVRRIIAG